MQKGPWKYNGAQVVDATGEIISLNGVSLAIREINGAVNLDAMANTQLLAHAPQLNNVVGKLLEIMADPYTDDNHRLDKIYILTEELREAYIPGANYKD